MAELFKDIIPSILQTKKPVITAENENDYVPFICNRALSYHYDTVLYAQEMNMFPGGDKLMAYKYYLHSIRAYKRPFRKWHKREVPENLQIVKDYYNLSDEKAAEALMILSDDQISELKRRMDPGGNVESRRTRVGKSSIT